MEFMTGVWEKEETEFSRLISGELEGSIVKVNGMVHAVRTIGGVVFVVLRKREGLLQCVCPAEDFISRWKGLKEETAVEAIGVLKKEMRAPNGMEIHLTTAPVFRAEKHSTRRHLYEYTSLDFEMGYISGMEELMAMETGCLQYILSLLAREYDKELSLLDVTLPDAARIPAVRFQEARRLAAEKYGRQIKNPNDLEPDEETLTGRYFKYVSMGHAASRRTWNRTGTAVHEAAGGRQCKRTCPVSERQKQACAIERSAS